MEVKIILILLISHYVGLYIFKPKLNILACGIFGWAGKETSDFNRDKFDKLGMYNVTRGRDSCGFTIDGLKYSGYGAFEKEYTEYILKYGNSQKPTKIPLVLGHTRQASPGIAVTEENIHPFAFGVNKKVTIEDKLPYHFLFAHNGTLKNHKELAKKYNVPSAKLINNVSKDKSDSNILGEIIYKTKSFNVLGEYIGTAACAFIDTVTNTLYLFRGESREYPYSYSKDVEERPMFYYIENENSVYFSSIKNTLFAIGGDNHNVFELDANTVYAISDGDIKNAKKTIVNRSEVSQRESIISNTHDNVERFNYGQGANHLNTAFNKSTISHFSLNNSSVLKYTRKYGSSASVGPINSPVSVEESKGLISFRNGVFYRNSSEVYSGIALNVKNFGLVNIFNFLTLQDVMDIENISKEELLERCNDIIRKHYYFKLPSQIHMKTFETSEGNELIRIHDFIASNDYGEKEVNYLFESKLMDKYFFINPGSLDVSVDYLTSLDELTFIYDGLIIKDHLEFTILSGKVKNQHYVINGNFRDKDKMRYHFTNEMDTISIAPHFKYYISDKRIYTYNEKAVFFYNPEYQELDNEYIQVEGAPYIVHFIKGTIDGYYLIEEGTKRIYLCDAFKASLSEQLLSYKTSIVNVLRSLEKDFQVLYLKDENEPKDNLLALLSNLSVDYTDIDLLTDKVVQKALTYSFKPKELEDLLDEDLLSDLIGLSPRDIALLDHDVLDSLLSLSSAYLTILNTFDKKGVPSQFLKQYLEFLTALNIDLEINLGA